MASGGIRSNFGRDENLTYGETGRTLRWAAVDSAGDAVTDFSGWEVDFFLLNELDDSDGLTALGTSNLYTNTEAGTIDIGTEPNIDMPLPAAFWTAFGTSRERKYELWRTDSGNERRIAYGAISVEH